MAAKVGKERAEITGRVFLALRLFFSSEKQNQKAISSAKSDGGTCNLSQHARSQRKYIINIDATISCTVGVVKILLQKPADRVSFAAQHTWHKVKVIFGTVSCRKAPFCLVAWLQKVRATGVQRIQNVLLSTRRIMPKRYQPRP